MIISIDQIHHKGMQARAVTNDAVVEEYAKSMMDGATFPAIAVFWDGEKYWLADGMHRLLAVRANGAEEIDAEVHDGGKADAMWYAAAANQDHGLRRSNADKNQAVIIALQTHPEMSDRAIADHVGVSNTMVSIVRSSIASKTKKKPPTERVDIKGKPFKVVERHSPTAVKDATGRDVPDGVIELWQSAMSKSALVSSVEKIVGDIEEAGGDAPEWAEVKIKQLLADLKNAVSQLKLVLPYALCPSCSGLTGNCRMCKDRGFISEFMWKTVVSAEQKQLIQKSLKK